MISDLILPPEKVNRMFPSVKSADCLKYLQQCLIRINSYSQSSANIRNCSDFKVYCKEITTTNVLSSGKAQWGCDCGIIGNEKGYVLCHA